MNVVVTGAAGFIGRHVVEALQRTKVIGQVVGITRATAEADLKDALRVADAVFHLAGANRPSDVSDFDKINRDFTASITGALADAGRKPLLVYSSSSQAGQDNPYGKSKLAAEEVLQEWASRTGAPVKVFRLKNVFGKWCRPNYNSVTATFCHNIAHDLPITVSDTAKEIELIYIDDVVAALLACLDGAPTGFERRDVAPAYRVTLGELAAQIQSFRDSRRTLVLPALATDFARRLYATYLSYLSADSFSYALQQRNDDRGSLAEFIKSASFGQIFVSRTKPGITRGNHYHHTKTEKFLVLEGSAIIRLRHIERGEVIEHRVKGSEFKVLDIPPGYSHSIENTGANELITLFWASEIFDPAVPDTYFTPVLR